MIWPTSIPGEASGRMDFFQVNKLLGALLATVFVVLSLGIVRTRYSRRPCLKSRLRGRRRSEERQRTAAIPAPPNRRLLNDRSVTRPRPTRPLRRHGLREVRGLPYHGKGRPQQGEPQIVGHQSNRPIASVRATPTGRHEGVSDGGRKRRTTTIRATSCHPKGLCQRIPQWVMPGSRDSRNAQALIAYY